MSYSEYDNDNKLYHFMSKQEEKEFFDEVCYRVVHNTRFYLDNLDSLDVFRVSFINYSYQKKKSI